MKMTALNILSLCLFIIFATSSFSEEPSPSYKVKRIKTILSMEINSSINPATYNFLKSGSDRAKSEGHDALLITMNTPGGLVSTTKDILTLIGEQNIPTIVWVKPEGASATSAGAIISAGAHLLFMSEGTNIGAATPITMSGDIEGKKDKNPEKTKKENSLKEKLPINIPNSPEGKSSDARAKAVNDLVALVASLSEARGRNGEAFSEMIKTAASFKAREAAEKNLINDIVNTRVDLKEKINGNIVAIKGEKFKLDTSEAEYIIHEMDLGLSLLNIFADPSLAYLLFLIGAALIYFEMQAPGGFIAGSIGAVCLVLAGIGFQVLPLNFGALGLIILSFALFIIEIYVTSYGILSLAGLGSLIAGSLFLFRSEAGDIQLEISMIISAVGGIGAFIGLIAYNLIRDRHVGRDTQFNSLVGSKGTVMAILEEIEGKPTMVQIKAAGEFWKANVSESFKVGDHIIVCDQSRENHLLTIKHDNGEDQ